MRPLVKTLPVLLLALALGGCSRLGYYAHLGKGGFALVTRAESADELLGDAETPEELKNRLRLARELLEFARDELGLPVGRKYRKYLDVERPYVVWTVVAAPEFSLVPKTWCFPIAGCVGYRGFFTPEKAESFAERLRQQGFEVSVGGVRAFSSLGWFGDPLLNTFLFDEDRRLAGLLFHELAHGLVYTPDDTAFNESFASAVERAGVELWLASHPSSPSSDMAARVDGYRQGLAAADASYAVVERIRDRLEALYASPSGDLTVEEMRARKADLFAELQHDLVSLDPEGGSAFGGWIGRDLDNADLASVGFYREHLAAFTALRLATGDGLDSFYASARCLAELQVEERRRRLENRSWGECILDRS